MQIVDRAIPFIIAAFVAFRAYYRLFPLLRKHIPSKVCKAHPCYTNVSMSQILRRNKESTSSHKMQWMSELILLTSIARLGSLGQCLGLPLQKRDINS